MGKRRRAREAAIQYHFWRDLQHGAGPEKIEEFWEFCLVKPSVREFAQPLIEGMIAHLPEIDDQIRKYAENYNLNRISAVDRNVLRLAIYRSEEHTSELQSRGHLVCRLLLEKKKT